MDTEKYFIQLNEIETFYKKYNPDKVEIKLGRGSFIRLALWYNPKIDYKEDIFEIKDTKYHIKIGENFNLNGYKFSHFSKIDTTNVDKDLYLGLPKDTYQLWIVDKNNNILDKLNILNKNK